MENPVVLESGRSYEKSIIQEWFKRGKSTDPLTNKKLTTKSMFPNINLKILIDQVPEIMRKQKNKKSIE